MSASLNSESSEESLRAEVRAFVGANWDPDAPLLTWRRALLQSGLAAPSWPVEWHGRGLAPWADAVVRSEIMRAGAVSTPLGAGTGLAGPTILTHGPDAVRSRFLARLLTGEDTWCQLFSEPGAGSDLAGLSTRADLDGDEWVVSGQKVWNTSAHHADYAILVARSDWNVPKHRGLTYFALPMKQEGVEVRPLRQMNDHSSFNEVFLSEARIPADHLIGDVGGGWGVAMTTLAFERHFGGLRRPEYGTHAGRALDEARAEAEEHFRTYSWYPQRAGRVDLVVPQARAHDRAGDPVVRQQIAALEAMQRASGWTSQRAEAARALGRPPGSEGSLGKLALSNVARAAARVHSTIAGADGMLTGPRSDLDGTIAEILVSVPGQSIAGGTDEIQHNIIGEKVLGLPREPSVDRELPFREVRRNA